MNMNNQNQPRRQSNHLKLKPTVRVERPLAGPLLHYNCDFHTTDESHDSISFRLPGFLLLDFRSFTSSVGYSLLAQFVWGLFQTRSSVGGMKFSVQ